MDEKKEEKSVMIRTILKKDVYDRLKVFAQKYGTGRGDWDFGVGIEVLLDWYDESRIGVVNDKIDMIINLLSEGKEGERIIEEPESIELLGGKKESI